MSKIKFECTIGCEDKLIIDTEHFDKKELIDFLINQHNSEGKWEQLMLCSKCGK